MTTAPLSRPARLYVGAVIVAGLAALAQSVHGLALGDVGYGWLVLALLTVCSSSFIVKLPTVPASISVSEVFIFTCFLLYGREAGVLTAALDGVALSILVGMRSPVRILFNASGLAVSVWLSGHLVALLFGFRAVAHQPLPLAELLLPVLVFTLAHFAINSWLTAFAIAAETRRPPQEVWSRHFLWLSLNYLWGAALAALLVHNSTGLSLPAIAVVIPLLGTMYLTFKSVLARVRDADQHLADLNKLYLCTIETLAMAIDAKDQTTHGHIRRVQTCAVGLAKALGLAQPAELKAIEAAALLHDMGKLAVPEYILNKPGKLTPAEFEKMKLHATVGADILAAVDFPYPVVPVVRHHHENWDGTGYPAGLAGARIPIGARILSVVDCFDALTSDRPYRPALSTEAALAILRERRGTMYDPMIVDKFIEVHAAIIPREAPVTLPDQALEVITLASRKPQDARGLLPAPGPGERDGDPRPADEILGFLDAVRALAGQTAVADTADVLGRRLLRLLPAQLCALYLYDAEADRLTLAHAVGDHADRLAGLQLEMGQCLSGWVAAHRHLMLNSDPALDLAPRMASFPARLRSALCAPLLLDRQLVGVLSFYAADPDAFTDEHRRIVTLLSRQVATSLHQARAYETACQTTRRDRLTGLPQLAQLEEVLTALHTGADESCYPVTLLTLTVPADEAADGARRLDERLRSLAAQATACLRGSDLLFRSGPAELAVLLMQTDPAFASAVAQRLAQIDRAPEAPPLRIGAATAPGDSLAPRDLLHLARQRMLPDREVARAPGEDTPNEGVTVATSSDTAVTEAVGWPSAAVRAV